MEEKVIKIWHQPDFYTEWIIDGNLTTPTGIAVFQLAKLYIKDDLIECNVPQEEIDRVLLLMNSNDIISIKMGVQIANQFIYGKE